MPVHSVTDAAVLEHVHPIDDGRSRYDSLIEAIGDRRVVLIGEASHGTHEFYAERAAVTKRLIAEKGFNAVAVEADWPDAYRVNTYVRGRSSAADAERALAGFERFPTWMWRNTVVVDFAEWLREHNAGAPERTEVGFYGLDLYSLYTSAANVVEVLDRIDPEAARRARDRYACFEQFGEDSQAYGYAAAFAMDRSCEDEVVAQLLDVQRTAAEYARRDGQDREAEAFYLEQNARLVEAAEEYYREMFRSRVSTWNLRDDHMAATLDALLGHLDRPGRPARVVVWEHNSHIGDARATEMSARGEHNVGQLARQRYGRDAFSIGLTTYRGTVTAASDWGDPAERKAVRPGLPGSWEEAFHAAGADRFLLLSGEVHNWPPSPRIERAIGVIYRPERERLSHYFYAQIGEQFDAVVHLDETRALEPLERTQQWITGEAPATYPFASERG